MNKYKGKIVPVVRDYGKWKNSTNLTKKEAIINMVVNHTDCNAWAIACSDVKELYDPNLDGECTKCIKCLFNSKDLILEWAIDKKYITKEEALQILLEK